MTGSIHMGTLDLVYKIFTRGVELLEEMGEHSPSSLIGQLSEEEHLLKAMLELSNSRMTILGDPERDRFVYVTPTSYDIPLKWAIRWANLRGLIASERTVIRQGSNFIIRDSKVKGAPAHLVIAEEQLFGSVQWPGYDSFYQNGNMALHKLHPHTGLEPDRHAIIMEASPLGVYEDKAPRTIGLNTPNLKAFYTKADMSVENLQELLWLRELEAAPDVDKTDITVFGIPWSGARYLAALEGSEGFGTKLLSRLSSKLVEADPLEQGMVPEKTIVFAARTDEERCMSCCGRTWDLDRQDRREDCRKCGGTGRILRKGREAVVD